MLEDSKERLEKWVGGLESRICERDFSGIVVIGKDDLQCNQGNKLDGGQEANKSSFWGNNLLDSNN